MDECENLPKNMCDSCIIQLNVAYNLKKNAIQSDLKLRQYMIEFGINVTSYTTCSINTVSVIRPPAMILPANATSESVTITTAKSTTVAPPVPQQQTRTFPVMPVIIKEEPVDYEVMSDITVETNTEAFEEHMRNQRNRTNGHRSLASTSSSSNKSLTPLPNHSMVSVNTKSLVQNGSSDTEFINAYILTPSTSTNSEQAKKASPTKSPQKQKTPEIPTKPSPKSKKPTTPTAKSARKRRREIEQLRDNTALRMKIHISTDSVDSTSRRQTRQQLKETHNDENRPQSRSRSAAKMDYKSFFSTRTATPVNGTSKSKRRMSVDSSINHMKRKGRSSNTSAKTTNKKKHTANIRKRRSSVAHNRSSI